jgi:hypothetical protein
MLPVSSTSSVSKPRNGPAGVAAVWDVCADDRVRIVDTSDGTVLRRVGLRGYPAWSADGRWLASLDDVDGTIRVAEVATGTVRVVARLGIPEYAFDSCGVSGVVLGWSPDGSSILVSYTDYSAPQFQRSVEVFRADGSASRLLWHRAGERGFKSQVTASWLNDGDVMLVALGDDEISAIKVQRGDPWAVFPGERVTLPRPDVQLLFSPRIAPGGARIAFATLDGLVNHERTPDTTGSVIIVDSATGEPVTVSTHEAYTGSFHGLGFSPDGSHVAFVEYDEAVTYPAILVVAATDGSGDVTVRGLPDTEHVSWSADNHTVLAGGINLKRIDPATGHVVELIARPRRIFDGYPELVPAATPIPLMCAGHEPTIVGTSAVTTGTAGRDVIVAHGTVFARGGPDLVCVGPEGGIVHGGTGADEIHGGSGLDVLLGGRGRDVLRAWGSADRLRGGPANDVLIGGSGADRMVGADGDDSLRGKGRWRPHRRGHWQRRLVRRSR